MNGVSALARLAWMRLARGRLVWVVALLVLLPVAGAAVVAWGAQQEDPSARWRLVGELTLRSLVLLAPVLLLCGVVSDENDGRTYTYLWSRPIRRQALAVGRLVAVTPALVVAAALALTAAFAVVGLGGELDWARLPRALGAAALGVIAASAFAVGVGALFPRHPLVVALGWVFFAEQILSAVPAVRNLSVLYHVEVIARLPRGPSGSVGGALVALAVLSLAWLALAWWRLDRLELGSAEG